MINDKIIPLPPKEITVQAAILDPIELAKLEDAEKDVLCTICFEGDWDDDNKIVYCDECDLTVHQICYSIANEELEDNKEWFCDSCHLVRSYIDRSLRPPKVVCCMCSKEDGAMRATTDNPYSKWCHVICYNWIPQIKDLGFEYDVSDALTPDRLKWTCEFCEKSRGCIRCSHVGCPNTFHATCAFENKNHMGTTEPTPTCPSILYSLCSVHTKAKEKGLLGKSKKKSPEKIEKSSERKKNEGKRGERKNDNSSNSLTVRQEKFNNHSSARNSSKLSNNEVEVKVEKKMSEASKFQSITANISTENFVLGQNTIRSRSSGSLSNIQPHSSEDNHQHHNHSQTPNRSPNSANTTTLSLNKSSQQLQINSLSRQSPVQSKSNMSNNNNISPNSSNNTAMSKSILSNNDKYEQVTFYPDTDIIVPQFCPLCGKPNVYFVVHGKYCHFCGFNFKCVDGDGRRSKKKSNPSINQEKFATKRKVKKEKKEGSSNEEEEKRSKKKTKLNK